MHMHLPTDHVYYIVGTIHYVMLIITQLRKS